MADSSHEDEGEDFLDRTESAAGRPRDESPESDEDLWSSDATFQALRMERSVHPTETPEQMTKRILQDAGPAAAARLVHIAMHSRNDNTSLAAAKYIADLVYSDDSGKVKAPWEELVADVVSQAELLANESSSS